MAKSKTLCSIAGVILPVKTVQRGSLFPGITLQTANSPYSSEHDEIIRAYEAVAEVACELLYEGRLYRFMGYVKRLVYSRKMGQEIKWGDNVIVERDPVLFSCEVVSDGRVETWAKAEARASGSQLLLKNGK